MKWYAGVAGRGAWNWKEALPHTNTLNPGNCDLTDGSSKGDWRLPNVRELQSLIDYGSYLRALPSGHPFTDVQLGCYWSSTSLASLELVAWCVNLSYGLVTYKKKTDDYFVWPVRGGQ